MGEERMTELNTVIPAISTEIMDLGSNCELLTLKKRHKQTLHVS